MRFTYEVSNHLSLSCLCSAAFLCSSLTLLNSATSSILLLVKDTLLNHTYNAKSRIAGASFKAPDDREPVHSPHHCPRHPACAQQQEQQLHLHLEPSNSPSSHPPHPHLTHLTLSSPTSPPPHPIHSHPPGTPPPHSPRAPLHFARPPSVEE